MTDGAASVRAVHFCQSRATLSRSTALADLFLRWEAGSKTSGMKRRVRKSITKSWDDGLTLSMI